MSATNLEGQQAQEKYKELTDGIDFCMMNTGLDERPIPSIPMSTKKVDSNGKTWFLSNKNSDHNKNLEKDAHTQLIYANPKGFEFLSAFGKTTISTDQSKIDELYGPSDDNWFEGKNDPNITVLCFEPDNAKYWDTKSNMVVTALKMGYGTITGQKMDISETGELAL